MDAPIHTSNVMLVDPTNGKPTRLKFEVRDGVKRRIGVATGADLGAVGKKK